MNKSQLIKKIAYQADINQASAEGALNALTKAITDELKEGGSVSLTGFGTFSVKTRSGRKGRNPQTGEAITIPEARVPSFKLGKLLKDTCN